MFSKSPIVSFSSLIGQSDGLSHSESPSPSPFPSPGATDRSKPKFTVTLPAKGKDPSPLRGSPNPNSSVPVLGVEPMRPSVELPSYDEVIRSSSSQVDHSVDQAAHPSLEDTIESADSGPVSVRALAVRREAQVTSDTLSFDPIRRTMVTNRTSRDPGFPHTVRTPSPLNPNPGRITFEGSSSSNATSTSSNPSIDSPFNLDLSEEILDILPSLSPSSHARSNWTEWAKPIGAPDTKRYPTPGEPVPPKRPMRVRPPLLNSSYLTVPGQATRKRLNLMSTGAPDLSPVPTIDGGLDQAVTEKEVVNEASPYWCSSSAYQASSP